jgi:hypothetical protein
MKDRSRSAGRQYCRCCGAVELRVGVWNLGVVGGGGLFGTLLGFEESHSSGLLVGWICLPRRDWSLAGVGVGGCGG